MARLIFGNAFNADMLLISDIKSFRYLFVCQLFKLVYHEREPRAGPRLSAIDIEAIPSAAVCMLDPEISFSEIIQIRYSGTSGGKKNN